MENSKVKLAEYLIGKVYDLLQGFPNIQGITPAKKHNSVQLKIDRWDFGLKSFKGDIKGEAELNGGGLKCNIGLKTRMGLKKSTKVFPLEEYVVVEGAVPHLAKLEELKKQLGAMLKEINA